VTFRAAGNEASELYPGRHAGRRRAEADRRSSRVQDATLLREYKTVNGPAEPWLLELAQANPGLEFSLVWADIAADNAVGLVARHGKLDRRTEMNASDVLSPEATWF
jgi:hypothetical protein